MIGFLRGRLLEREAERLLVEVEGVGYVVHVPASTLLELPATSEDRPPEVELRVSMQVREDSITLFGFLTQSERRTFELLLGVSGVGPRIALAALSSLGPEAIGRAIADGDAARLGTVPGIGRKTAERMVVDLRDRMAVALGEPTSAAGAVGGDAAGGDVVSALVNLGYPARQASKAVKEELSGEEASAPAFDVLLRRVLRRLSRA